MGLDRGSPTTQYCTQRPLSLATLITLCLSPSEPNRHYLLWPIWKRSQRPGESSGILRSIAQPAHGWGLSREGGTEEPDHPAVEDPRGVKNASSRCVALRVDHLTRY